MKVIKIGGGCLKGQAIVSNIINLIADRGKGNIFVLSALSGVTDILASGINKALKDEDSIPELIKKLKQEHYSLAKSLIINDDDYADLVNELDKIFLKIERYYFGINFTREATLRMQDIITSYGEQLSVILISKVLQARGENSDYIMPSEAGIITDGKFCDATALMQITSENLQKNVLPLMVKDKIMFIPGFFGISESGEVTTFGRGGTDYSAAVVAASVNAEILEIWKDTEGFMSADPHVVPDAKLIPELSYEEASELAYSGASILHPRTVEPVRQSGIKIAIKNTLNPDAPGSLIKKNAPQTVNIVKSVSHTIDIAILKVYASGVGARQGILAQIAGSLSDAGINIKSVVTSQTCISLLLAPKDIEKSHLILENIKPRPYRELKQITNIALISIVGDGLDVQRGIAAKCFSAVSEAKVNIDMISFGPSTAALYFLVDENELEKTLNALHSFFFDSYQDY